VGVEPPNQLPRASVEPADVTEWEDGVVRAASDYLAAEEPLQICINGRPLVVTMRTPGNDEELAAGFLWTEGLIQSREQILEFGAPVPRGPDSRGRDSRGLDSRGQEPRVGAPRNGGPSNVVGNVVELQLVESAQPPQKPERTFVATSSCGLCGKSSIDEVRAKGLRRIESTFTVDAEMMCALPEKLRARQQVFERTGGLHAAALFNGGGELLALREDIGRHNAVDKIVGWALLAGLIPLSQHVLLVSGRGGFEIVQKAIAAGVPIVASVSAPSSLAVELAREMDLTLIGFLRGRRFVVYSGEARCRM
jgi:FdhD protein